MDDPNGDDSVMAITENNPSERAETRPGVFRIGDEIDGRYRVKRCIARGSHADIYLVSEVRTTRERIVKAEAIRPGHSEVMMEIIFLAKDDVQRSRCFPRVFETGEFSNWRYVVMEVLGPSLQCVLDAAGRLTISCGLRIGLAVLACIERLHGLGYMHRDVKPSNLLLRPDRAAPLVLIDFGCVSAGPSKGGGFVGSVAYASVFAHDCWPMSFRDDLWSWWYVLVRVLAGPLPWEKKEKRAAYEDKMDGDVMKRICEGLPRQIHAIYRTLVQVRVGDTPDYRLLRSFLVEAMDETGSRFDHPWDWETFSPHVFEKLKPVCLMQMNPDVLPAPPGDVLLPAVVPGEETPLVRPEGGCCRMG